MGNARSMMGKFKKKSPWSRREKVSDAEWPNLEEQA